MADYEAITLAKNFRKIDSSYKKTEKQVRQFLEDGYTPEEALMLSGIGGYND